MSLDLTHPLRSGVTSLGDGKELEAALEQAHGDLDRGKTMPFSWYTDPEIFRLEQQRIFARSWQYVGHLSQVARPGSYFTSQLGDFPVVVTRSREGNLSAHANICPHRGNILAKGCGPARTLTCGYHSWTFDLDGALRSAPRADSESDFVTSDIRLSPLAVDTWESLVFINRDENARPLAELVGGVAELCAERGIDLGRHPLRASRSWDIAANWKVTLDNNTECYHCQTVHPEFSSKYHVDAENYKITTFDRCFSHESRPKEPADISEDWNDFHLSYVFPNFMLSGRGNDYFYTYTYVPIDAHTTRQYNDYYFPESWSESEVESAIAEILVIMEQDWAVFESVQRGLVSGVLANGQLMPSNEALLIHNQRLVIEGLRGLDGKGERR